VTLIKDCKDGKKSGKENNKLHVCIISKTVSLDIVIYIISLKWSTNSYFALVKPINYDIHVYWHENYFF
jgi:hypothetical protein